MPSVLQEVHLIVTVGSVVVDAMFIVAPIVCEGLCLVLIL